MNEIDFQALLPLLLLAAGAVVVMLQIAFLRNTRLTAILAGGSMIIAAVSCRFALDDGPTQVTPLLQADNLAMLFTALFCVAGAVTAALSLDYINHHGDEPEEFFLLLLLSTLGACVLTYAAHVASLLLGLELLSVALSVALSGRLASSWALRD